MIDGEIMQIIKAPWQNTLIDLVRNAKKKIYLSSPSIKEDIAKIIIENKKDIVDCKLLAKFTLANIRGGGLDLNAIKIFQDANFSQKNITNLHAKIFIFDNKTIITSANLTNGGLNNNLEYGILIENQKEIENDFLTYYHNLNYDTIQNKHILKVESIIKELPIVNTKSKNNIFSENLNAIRNNLSTGNQTVFDGIIELDLDDLGIFTSQDIYKKIKNKFSGIKKLWVIRIY